MTWRRVNARLESRRGIDLRLRLLAVALFASVSLTPTGHAETVRFTQLRDLLALADAVSVPDEDLAQRLKGLSISTRVPDRDAAPWMNRSYGPQSLAEIQRLLAESGKRKPESTDDGELSLRVLSERGLTAVTPAAQDEAMARVRDYAAGYTASFPNFTCVRETEMRSSDSGFGKWRRERSEEERLSLENGRDQRRPIRSKTYRGFFRRRANVISVTGEFGTLLEKIFDVKSQTAFSWKGALPNGNWLLSYRVPREYSSLTLRSGGRAMRAGYAGFVEANPQSGEIFQLTYRDEGLPEDFAIKGSEGTVYYGLVEIDGRQYLLPVRARMLAYVKGIFLLNIAVYRNYRKFDASSDIRFDAAAAISEETQTGEPR